MLLPQNTDFVVEYSQRNRKDSAKHKKKTITQKFYFTT